MLIYYSHQSPVVIIILQFYILKLSKGTSSLAFMGSILMFLRICRKEYLLVCSCPRNSLASKDLSSLPYETLLHIISPLAF